MVEYSRVEYSKVEYSKVEYSSIVELYSILYIVIYIKLASTTHMVMIYRSLNQPITCTLLLLSHRNNSLGKPINHRSLLRTVYMYVCV
jgi:hypothetical protein